MLHVIVMRYNSNCMLFSVHDKCDDCKCNCCGGLVPGCYHKAKRMEDVRHFSYCSKRSYLAAFATDDTGRCLKDRPPQNGFIPGGVAPRPCRMTQKCR